MPGKEVVILGSGDIGLIMARRMTFEGAKVKAVVELMPYSSGLNRNIVQCVKDFDIPLMFSHTVVDIKGEGRVTGVVIAQVDDKLQPIMSTAKEISCDTLLLSIGLIPQNETLLAGADVTLSPITGGAVVDENMMTSVDGVFECGNVLHVHDLVDFVSKESEEAGRSAAEFIKTGSVDRNYVETRGVDGVRYVVPQRLSKDCKADKLQMKLRVGNVFKNVRLVVEADGEEIYSKKKQIVTPGEMESIVLNEDQIGKAVKCKMLSVALRGVKIMKEMICICCPMGCRLSVDDSDKNDIKVSGNTCPRGAKYARDEVICPKRMVTSVVEVEGGEIGMVSVKTSDSIPKDRMFDALKLLDNLLIPAPVKLGQVIVENVLGLGVDFVATKDVPKKLFSIRSIS